MEATGSGLVFGIDSEPNAIIFYFFRLTYHMQRAANLLSSTVPIPMSWFRCHKVEYNLA